MPWDPDQYHRFQRERSAPFEDLIRLVQHRPDMRVIDLGCGTGELTARLADMLPGSNVLGVDSSPSMLERATGLARPRLQFELADIAAVQGEWDLVFSHAALHWLPDHPTLVPRLLKMVRPGGQLAVQMPRNQDHPSHRLIAQVAREEPFHEALQGWEQHSPVLDLADYAELLWANGGRSLTAVEKIYPHVLESADALADWTSGTTLVPYFERLPSEMHDPFLDRYRGYLRELFSMRPVFYGFRRVLLAATRQA